MMSHIVSELGSQEVKSLTGEVSEYDYSSGFGTWIETSVPYGSLDAKVGIGLGMNIVAFIMNVISIVVIVVMTCKKEPMSVPYLMKTGSHTLSIASAQVDNRTPESECTYMCVCAWNICRSMKLDFYLLR